MLDIKVLIKLCQPKTGYYRNSELRNEELQNFNSLPAIKAMIKLWNTKRHTEHVVCLGEMNNPCNVLVLKLEARGHLRHTAAGRSSSYLTSIRPRDLLRFHSIFSTVFLGFFFYVVCRAKDCLGFC